MMQLSYAIHATKLRSNNQSSFSVSMQPPVAYEIILQLLKSLFTHTIRDLLIESFLRYNLISKYSRPIKLQQYSLKSLGKEKFVRFLITSIFFNDFYTCYFLPFLYAFSFLSFHLLKLTK